MLAASLAAALALAAPDLATTAERTGFARTGRADEAERLCLAFERAFPGRARCLAFGVTPEGRTLRALVASADGVLDPAAARARRRPVVAFQGGIHAGEIDGKDAGFIALRELLTAGRGGALSKVTALFVPIFNLDGHERFGPNQRPNQRGPEETGWRTTAQNLNLNRDYGKADAPEMRALLALLGAWDPILYADLHVTDGAQFEHDVALMVAPTLVPPAWPGATLAADGRALRDALLARLEREGHLPLPFYPSFVKDGDPASGFDMGIAPPRFSGEYWAARDRLGLLVETHSWRPYRHRVEVTRAVLRALLDEAAARGAGWLARAAEADREGARLAGRPVAVAWEADGPARTIAFRGYAYTREPSPVSGAPIVRYDESRPEVWQVPLREAVRPSITVTLPRGGWIVPAPQAPLLAERLAAHGLAFTRLARAPGRREVEAFRATAIAFEAKSYEGRQGLKVQGAWRREAREVGAGALFVPVAQPHARLAAFLLEPASPDAFLAWGLFNAAFERKEYLEDYVTEPFARELLARDAAVRADFERRLREDPAFAADPAARLEYFARRHPSWDASYGLYPVLRTDEVLR
jgi:murein tripeptide amidase MpaA